MQMPGAKQLERLIGGVHRHLSALAKRAFQKTTSQSWEVFHDRHPQAAGSV